MAFGILNDKSSKHYLYKCLSTDTKPTTFEGKTIPGGSYCYETDTTTLYEFDGIAWVIVEQYSNSVGLGTLIAGEDQDNDVLAVEERYGYEVVDWGAIAADEVLGATGAIGDVLRRVTITEAPAGAALDIYDGTVAGGTLILSIPAATAIGTTYELGIQASAAGFTVDFNASATAGIIVCVGRFT